MPKPLNIGWPADRILHQVCQLHTKLHESIDSNKREIEELNEEIQSSSYPPDEQRRIHELEAVNSAHAETLKLMDELFKEWDRRNDPINSQI